jgi:hypothetical protein
MAPRVAALMSRELARDSVWEADQVKAFHQTASGFLLRENQVSELAGD